MIPLVWTSLALVLIAGPPAAWRQASTDGLFGLIWLAHLDGRVVAS